MTRFQIAALMAIFALSGICLEHATASAEPFVPVQQLRGINWACPGDNYSTGVLYVSGLSAATSRDQAKSLAGKVASAVLSIDGTLVRMPVNPSTVASNFWPVYKSEIDTLLKKGLKVDLCYWTSNGKVGVIDDTSSWNSMWATLVRDYKSNPNVYFEPINEPFGYNTSALESIYSGFQQTYNLPHWKCFLDGTGYADNVSTIGAAPDIQHQYLSQHYYQWYFPGGRSTNWQDYENDLSGRVGQNASRTIITEMGTVANSNLDYYQQSSDGLSNIVEYITGATKFVHDNNMGSIDWAGIRDGDSYSWWNHTELTQLNNPSMVMQYQWSWHAKVSARK